jgi:hypothetical protein
MSQIVVNGALLLCSNGLTPGTANLKVKSNSSVNAEGNAVATIMDHAPEANIPSFGMCKSQLNPATATATAAALGTPTPGKCTPVIPAPWTPGSPTVTVGNLPALTSNSSCVCTALGKISVQEPETKATTTG